MQVAQSWEHTDLGIGIINVMNNQLKRTVHVTGMRNRLQEDVPYRERYVSKSAN